MKSAIDIKTLKGLTQDSRQVKEGYLFAAFPGAKLDGRDYIEDAIRYGATAILAPEGTVLPDLFSESEVTLLTDENPRALFAKMAAEFYGLQPEYSVAITGTNGKTSCAHFIKQLWDAQNIQAASIGTLGARGPHGEEGLVRSGSMTTPDPVSLHAELADMSAAGVTHLAMEASSHGLDQYRLDGVQVKVAAFTNLSRDHLDYHEDMERYFAAKARLFSDILIEGGTAVLNADIPEYDALLKIVQDRNLQVLSYGLKGEDLKLISVEPHPHGQSIQIEVFGEAYDLELHLVGEFQVMNVLCSLGLVLAENRDQAKTYIESLAGLQGAPGRLELVSGHPKNAAVYIDYAHTPDALETILKSLRPHTQGKLICVFGCGGDRDSGKRPIMGRIATEHADHVIVTDDNPRSEKPELIRADILKEALGAEEIGDRIDAIKAGVEMAGEGDVLVIAGKGHEQGQVFVNHTDEFDDFKEAQKAIEEFAS